MLEQAAQKTCIREFYKVARVEKNDGYDYMVKQRQSLEKLYDKYTLRTRIFCYIMPLCHM